MATEYEEHPIECNSFSHEGFFLQTWSAALVQVCFTLNIGYGGIIVIASYNAKNNNCYKVR